MSAHAARCSGLMGVMFVAGNTDEKLIPDPEVRETMSSTVSELEHAMSAGRLVILKDGFAGAGFRSIVTSILRASRRGAAIWQVFGRLEPAVVHAVAPLPAGDDATPTVRHALDALYALRGHAHALASLAPALGYREL